MKNRIAKQLGVIITLSLLGSGLAAESLHKILMEIQGRLEQIGVHSQPLRLNRERLALYHYIGGKIHSFQKTYHLGAGFLDDVSAHLTKAFPEAGCFGKSNLASMLEFALCYPDLNAVPEVFYISWKHHCFLIERAIDTDERLSLIRLSIEKGWTSKQLEAYMSRPEGLSSMTASVSAPQPQEEGISSYWESLVEAVYRMWYGVVSFLNRFFSKS